MSDPHVGIVRAAFEGDIDAARKALASDPSCADTLVEGIDSRPLHCASHRGYREIVELLLEAGADVHAREGCSGTTALHWAAEGGHLAVARLLVQAGADLEPLDTWHELRPVDWCAVVRHAPRVHDDRAGVADYLEALGSERGIFGAIASGMSERVRGLVEESGDVLEARLGPASAALQPLHMAIAEGDEALVEVLCELGAPLGGLTARGHSPLALAMAGGRDACGALLEAAGATVDLPTLLHRGQLDAAAELLERGDGSLAPPGPYASLVHAFVQAGAEAPLTWMLDHGADPQVPGVYLGHEEWLTELRPLHLAAANGAVAVIGILLGRGAEVDVSDSHGGVMPLHLAAANGHRAAVEALLAAGADASRADRAHGATPAAWAAHSGHESIVALLAPPQASS